MKKLMFLAFLAVLIGIGIGISSEKGKPDQQVVVSPAWQNKYIQNIKQDRPDLFLEMFDELRKPARPDLPEYARHYQHLAWKKAQNNGRSALEDLDWQERGPGNVSGRTRGLLFDPGDISLQTWYAGSVGGGVWRTEDGGTNWTHLTEGLPQLAIGDLAISAANSDVIYAGTGEGLLSLPAIAGIGVWKSTDRGLTWAPLQATLEDARFASVTRMIINPVDENQLFIAVNNARRDGQSYVFRSDDGGATLQVVLEASGGRLAGVIQQLFYAEDFSQIFAAINSRGILRSVDLGTTWDTIYQATPGQERIEAAVYSGDPAILYASIEDESGLGNNGSGLFRTTDGGNNWQQIQREGGVPLAGWLGSQGWYDNTIAIHPSDPARIYVAGQPGIFQIDAQSDILTQVDERIDDDSETLDLVEELNSLQFPFSGFGPTEDLALQLGTSTGLGVSDRIAVDLAFSDNISSPVHRLSPALNGVGLPEFDTLIMAGIRATEALTGDPLVVAFADENQNGIWDAPVYPMDVLDELLTIEPLFIYKLLRSDDADPQVIANAFDQNMYTLMLAQAEDQVEDTTLLEGSFSIEQVSFPASASTQDFIVGGFKGVHVDHHNILLREKDGVLHILNGNDGGVSYSGDDAENFVQTGNTSLGYNTAQFYGVDKMNGEDRYIAGSQDNGTYFSVGDPDATTAWQSAPSGDGFEALWHYNNPDLILESLQFNGIFRTSDRGANWSFAELPAGADDGPFVTQLAGSKTDPDLVYGLSSAGVIRSTDFGLTWSIITMPEEWVFDGGYAPIEVSLADPNIVWTGGALREDDRLVVSDNGGTVFVPVARYDGPTGTISGIATHPFEGETAYILFGAPGTAKILKTQDLGDTWTDISGFRDPVDGQSTNGFPDVVTYSLLVMPFDTAQIWAGTEIGLFISEDAGASWQLAENGLPNTAIWDMKIVNDEVVVATHGRGIWSVTMAELANFEPSAAVLAPSFINLNQDIRTGDIGIRYELRQAYDSTRISFSFGDQPLGQLTLGANPSSLIDSISNNFNERIPDDTNVQVLAEIKSFVSGRELVGARQTVQVYRLDNDFITVEFVDSLNTASPGNFARFGFTIAQEDGFGDPALQSQHPHDQLINLLAVFQKPVIVNDKTNRIIYDQILILEPGDSDDINSSDFYDFGALEGSRDYGKTWTILSGGDASLDEAWAEIYDRGDVPGDDGLYRLAEIDLFDTYDAQDTILLRFRLFSDPFVVGWGMAVDNFTIGEPELSRRDLELRADVQVFPNPFADVFQVEIGSISGKVQLDLFDLQGRVLHSANLSALSNSPLLWRYDASQLPAGSYFLRIGSKGQRKSMRLMKM